jgi:hypothetical protein
VFPNREKGCQALPYPLSKNVINFSLHKERQKMWENSINILPKPFRFINSFPRKLAAVEREKFQLKDSNVLNPKEKRIRRNSRRIKMRNKYLQGINSNFEGRKFGSFSL